MDEGRENPRLFISGRPIDPRHRALMSATTRPYGEGCATFVWPPSTTVSTVEIVRPFSRETVAGCLTPSTLIAVPCDR
jgi:hypothetical protein